MFQIVVKLETWPSYSSDLFTITFMFILKHFSNLACEAALYLEVHEKRRCMANTFEAYTNFGLFWRPLVLALSRLWPLS